MLKNSKQLEVAYSRMKSRRNPSRFCGRAQNPWYRSAACISQKAHFATLKFGKERGPSQGVIQKCATHERSPRALKFEDRSEEQTLKQERCDRRDAWEMSQNVHKLKDKGKVTFYSPSEAWSLPAPSSKKPEDSEFCGGFWCINAHDEQERSELS